MATRLSLIGLGLLTITLSALPADAQWVWTPQTGRFLNLDRMPKETAELQLEHARSLMIAGETRKAYRETNKFDQFYSNSEFADDNQYLRGEIQMAQGRYLGAAREYQAVVTNYPDTDLYEQAIARQYEIGDLYYEQGLKRLERRPIRFIARKRPINRAIDVYEMVIDNQPFTPEAAQAQYKLGLCHYAKEDYLEAAFEYRRIVEDYGSSEFVDEASYGLTQCYYDMSNPPEYDQGPSKLAIETIDTFNQRFPGDSRAAGLETQRAEMRERIAQQRVLNAEYYERRQRWAAARLYYEGIVRDYGETQAANTARAWLEENPGVFSLEERYTGRAGTSL